MRKRSATIEDCDGYRVVSLGDSEIWDGADLALLREELTQLVKGEFNKAIGVDVAFVGYIPSGFFGMLYDYMELGISVRLHSPRESIQQLIWFREFFKPVENCEGVFQMMIPKQTELHRRESVKRSS